MLIYLQILFLICDVAVAVPNTNSFFLHPHIDICEGHHKRRISSSFCENDALILEKELANDCICLQGIWMSLDSKCTPKLHIGYKGCTKTENIQALKLAGTFGERNDFLVIATISKLGEVKGNGVPWPKVRLLRPIQKINVAGTIWVLNGRIVHQKNVYCVEHYPSANAEIIRKYNIIGMIYVKSQCFSTIGNPVAPVKLYNLNETVSVRLRCEQDCSKVSNPLPMKTKTVAKATTRTLHGLKRNALFRKDSINSREKSDRHIFELDLRNQHDLINTVMLRSAVHIAVNPLYYEFHELDIPSRSFTILHHLINVTLKACGENISHNLLKRAYSFFKVAYDVKGGDLNEVFQANETNEIINVLNDCSAVIRTMDFRMRPKCDEQVYSYKTDGSHYIPITVTKDHPDFSKSVILDIIWNMVDLTTAVCINPFKVSYLLYHRWEQGMEKLFTDPLRIYWQYPIPSRTLYTRLFGPNWELEATNLEKCVHAAYIKERKMSRLLRPLWTPGSRKRKHKFAFWKNHTLLYSLDGTQNEENLLVNFPMQTKSNTTRKVSLASVRGISSSPKKFHSFVCNKNYYCQSNT